MDRQADDLYCLAGKPGLVHCVEDWQDIDADRCRTEAENLASANLNLAERGGFEPPNGNIPLTVFETAAFDRSAISPDFKKSRE